MKKTIKEELENLLTDYFNSPEHWKQAAVETARQKEEEELEKWLAA